ncbi:MAG TPA: LCP family protein [Armatimonadota bacterium]|nr:LCP family protein [Armatimonadota bacterium]
MTQTVQVTESTLQHSAKEKQRRRLSIYRRLFLGVILFLIVSFTTLSILAGSVPNALRLLGLGAGFLKDKVIQAPPFGGQKQVNILLIGADVNFDGTGESRTDTIKLIHVDMDKKRVSMLSIPRDTWVTLPNGDHGRINSAYQLGGKEEANRVTMAKTAIETLLGDLSGKPLHIDHYIRIQTGGFVKIVDALGGIDINVEKKMDYEDPSQE